MTNTLNDYARRRREQKTNDSRPDLYWNLNICKVLMFFIFHSFFVPVSQRVCACEREFTLA